MVQVSKGALKGKIEPFFSEGTWSRGRGCDSNNWAGGSPELSFQALHWGLGVQEPLYRGRPNRVRTERRRVRQRGRRGPETQAVAKNNNTEKDPCEKKEDKLCVARGSRRYLESAGVAAAP